VLFARKTVTTAARKLTNVRYTGGAKSPDTALLLLNMVCHVTSASLCTVILSIRVASCVTDVFDSVV
jgi:hypothetical protein